MSDRAIQRCAVCYFRNHEDLVLVNEKAPDHEFTPKFDTDGEDTVFCPWCGADNGTDEAKPGSRWDCSECERVFDLEVEYTPVYSTSKPKVAGGAA